MPREDIILFSSLGAIGVVCGILIAALVRRGPHPFLSTTIGAFVSATLLGLCGGMAGMTFHYLRTGHSFGHAIGGGLAASMTFAAVAPFVSGVPALLVGMVLQCLLQRSLRRCRFRRPPPLPSVIHD